MTDARAGTNGGGGGTGGSALRRRRSLWLILAGALFILVQSIANVESTLADFARLGRIESHAHVWIWELSSVATWLALTPAIWWLLARARPPRMAWPLVVVTHAAATVPLSLIHVLGMIGLRELAYGAMAQSYHFDWPGALIYEYRKDVATYLLLAGFLAYAQWLLARPAAAARTEPRILEVADGTVTHRVPIEAIDWAAAAGNYVEIAWGQRMLLHRSTLAALAEQLGPGFARIHRGRLVRREAVRSIETDKSGDFTVTLASGATLRGSRRYREGL